MERVVPRGLTLFLSALFGAFAVGTAQAVAVVLGGISVIIPGPPANPLFTNNTTPTFSFSVDDGGSPTTAACRIVRTSFPPSTPPFSPCTTAGSHTSTSLAEGGYYFEVLASDGIGNSASDTHAFTIDTTAPTVTIDSGPPTYTNDNTPNFAFSITIDASPAMPECRVYASASTPPSFGACTSASGHTHTPIGDGAKIFEVRANDAASNVGPIASHSFTVDTVAPTVSITGFPPIFATNDTTPTFTFNASDGGGSPITVSCRVTTFPPTPTPPLGPCTTANSHTSDPLADGVHQFEVRVVDAAGNNGPNAENRSIVIDTVAPKVTAVNSIAVADWSSDGAAAIDVAVTKVQVTFDDDSMSDNSATQFSNWLPVAAGADGEIDTVNCGAVAGDDVALPLLATMYWSSARTVSLLFAGSRGLQAGRYRLIACATLTDWAGNGLDGAGDGGDAEPYLSELNVATNPRIVNPNFDGNLSGWTASGPVPSAWAQGSADGEAQAYSGAARLNTAAGAGATWRLEQCVTAEPGLFSFSGLTRITSATPGAPSVQLTVVGATSADCSGTLTPVSVSTPIAGDTGNAWSTLFAPVNPPPGTQSLRLSFDVSGAAASSYTVEFDRALYPGRIVLFDDGFETESP